MLKNGISGLKEKSRHHHWILHIWTSLSTNIQFQQTILNFWNKFAQKGSFQFKKETVNTAIDFRTFKLNYRSTDLNRQFFFFGPILPKKGISGLIPKDWASPLNSSHLI